MLLTAGTVLTGRELLRPGWIEVSGQRITAIGSGPPPGPADRELPAATVVPGFIDTHVHGGGGASFSGGAAETAAAVALHRRHGTTTLIASLVSEAPEDLLRQIRGLAEDARSGLIAGIHLEGPWLSPMRCGAHKQNAAGAACRGCTRPRWQRLPRLKFPKAAVAIAWSG